MCTIMTISYAFFVANKEEVLKRIRQDALGNPHGNSVILVGHRNTKMESMDIETIITVICNTTNWNRMFLHCRHATTNQQGLAGCHGFSSAGNGMGGGKSSGVYYVQHNGILRADMAKHFRVDSMYIPYLIGATGDVEAATSYLLKNESYANVFMINPDTGHVIVARCSGGSLCMDNENNYSTNECGAIKDKVPNAYGFEFYVAKYNFESMEANEFLNLVVENDWDTETIAAKYYRNMTMEQKQVVHKLRDEARKEPVYKPSYQFGLFEKDEWEGVENRFAPKTTLKKKDSVKEGKSSSNSSGLLGDEAELIRETIATMTHAELLEQIEGEYEARDEIEAYFNRS